MASAAKSATKKKATKKVKEKVEAVEGAEASPKKKKAPKKRKVAEQPRVKLYWGIFNQNLKRVAVFEYAQRKEAEKHCKDLSKAGTEHFIQKVRETIEPA